MIFLAELTSLRHNRLCSYQKWPYDMCLCAVSDCTVMAIFFILLSWVFTFLKSKRRIGNFLLITAIVVLRPVLKELPCTGFIFFGLDRKVLINSILLYVTRVTMQSVTFMNIRTSLKWMISETSSYANVQVKAHSGKYINERCITSIVLTWLTTFWITCRSVRNQLLTKVKSFLAL